ncbi:hypothetical protein [Amycolatopsis albispora]|uniref:Uncharacterized protein n=1 Tax=Amycolatopsis albispora TaxID=1804986 RepID=A0A344LF68_9PSEU|nr:hypothetical protein [Amycolatopsis albispora]AXB46692.1 hypothetical protein A4R43_33155 [Amycolatopsis albispora]
MSDAGAPVVDRGVRRRLKRWYIALAVLVYATGWNVYIVNTGSTEFLKWAILFGLATVGCAARIVVGLVRGTGGWRLHVDAAGIRLVWLPTGGWSLPWAEIGRVELRRRWLRPRYLTDPAYGYELRLTVPPEFFRKARAGRRARDVYTAEIELSEVEAYAVQERARVHYDGPVRATALPPAEKGGPQQKLIPRPIPPGTESYWGDRPFGPYFLYTVDLPAGGSVRTTSTVQNPLKFAGFLVSAVGVRWNSFLGDNWSRDPLASGFELTWAEIGTFRASAEGDEYLVDIVPGDNRFAQRHPEMRKHWLRPDGTYRLDRTFSAGALQELRGFIERYHPGAYEEAHPEGVER